MSLIETRHHQLFPVLNAAQIETAKRFASGSARNFGPGEVVFDVGERHAPAWLVLKGSMGHCQTNQSEPAKGAGLRHSGRQLTPLGQGGSTVLFEDVAAVEVAAVEQDQMPRSPSITHARSKSSPVPSATFCNTICQQRTFAVSE